MAMAYPYNQPIEVIHNAYTPQQTTEIASRMGAAKARMRIDKIFTSGFMAGAILAFACAAVSVVNTAPWYQENAPGVIKLFSALIFPFGLVAIVLTGADLCTGSFMVRFTPSCPLLVRSDSLPTNSSPQSLPYTAVPASSKCYNTGLSPFSAISLAPSSLWASSSATLVSSPTQPPQSKPSPSPQRKSSLPSGTKYSYAALAQTGWFALLAFSRARPASKSPGSCKYFFLVSVLVILLTNTAKINLVAYFRIRHSRI